MTEGRAGQGRASQNSEWAQDKRPNKVAIELLTIAIAFQLRLPGGLSAFRIKRSGQERKTAQKKNKKM